MRSKISIRRRVTSGNIKDEAMHQQRLENMRKNSELGRAVAIGLAGGVTFLFAVLTLWMLS